MQRFAWIVLVLALGAAAAAILATSGALPPTVASHFDGRGVPNGWMTRGFYTAFMLAFAVGLPLFIVAIVAGVARIAPGKVNVPNRGYWGAPERRGEAIAKLTTSACFLGALVAAFITALHFVLIEANSGPAPRLSTSAFLGVMGAFAAGLVAYALGLYAQFRVPR